MSNQIDELSKKYMNYLVNIRQIELCKEQFMKEYENEEKKIKDEYYEKSIYEYDMTLNELTIQFMLFNRSIQYRYYIKEYDILQHIKYKNK
mgnify:CR=1 FL=1|tara:strand:+ start:387 stop:659 length:273 start_codon:yes stop_codon:yes gene_type:complete